jgi:hypothetical protein
MSREKMLGRDAMGNGNVHFGIHECTSFCEKRGCVPLSHGANCEKVPHTRKDGYLHDDKDDKPYDIDGVMYCGRCHQVLTTWDWSK